MSMSQKSRELRTERRVDLVMEGGGVKGNALVGALAVLEERGYQPQNVAGTSAGAIVATALAAGYTPAEQLKILSELNFARFLDRGWVDRVPLLNRSRIGMLLSIIQKQGIYQGEEFLNWMREILLNKGIRTFRDLVHPLYQDDPRFRYKVRVIASDVTGRCLLALPQDATKLGLNPDDLEVAQAVRMSMSIPIFFAPVRVKNPQARRSHLIVDGGMLSNFPVWLFDTEGAEPSWPTFGLRLSEAALETPPETLPAVQASRNSMQVTVDFLWSMVETMTQAHDRMYINNANFARTISIPTHGVSTTNFHLTTADATALYHAGRKAAEEFLDVWDFEAYIAAFRSTRPTPGRRKSLVEEMRAAAEQAHAAPSDGGPG